MGQAEGEEIADLEPVSLVQTQIGVLIVQRGDGAHVVCRSRLGVGLRPIAARDRRQHDVVRDVAFAQRRDREVGYEDLLRSIPPMAELLEGAERKEGDFHFYSHLFSGSNHFFTESSKIRFVYNFSHSVYPQSCL